MTTTTRAPLHYDGHDTLHQDPRWVATVNYDSSISRRPWFATFDEELLDARLGYLVSSDYRLGTALASSPLPTSLVIEIWEAHRPLPCQACGALQPASRDECFSCGHDLKVYGGDCTACEGLGSVKMIMNRYSTDMDPEGWIAECETCRGHGSQPLEWAADRQREIRTAERLRLAGAGGVAP